MTLDGHVPGHIDLSRPGRRIRIWQPAATYDVPGKGEFLQRFAPGAFDRTVGQIVPLTYQGKTYGSGRVISADVAEDGSGVIITYEVLPR